LMADLLPLQQRTGAESGKIHFTSRTAVVVFFATVSDSGEFYEEVILKVKTKSVTRLTSDVNSGVKERLPLKVR